MKKVFFKIFFALALITVVGAGCSKVNTAQNQSGPIKYEGQDGRTALDLLKAKYPGKVETKAFTTGEFVQSINGQTADQTHYWAFYVNGQQATVGAGSYVTKSGDTIEWKLEAVNEKL